jgi:hypothetical protein
VLARAQFILLDDGGVEIIPFADVPSRDVPSLVSMNFEGPLSIGLSETYAKEIELGTVSTDGLPSFKAEERIKKVLAEKRQLATANILDAAAMLSSFNAAFGPRPYEARPIDELIQNLQNVRETYADHDAYELFGERAHRLNVHLLNGGHHYIEDGQIELSFRECAGLLIAGEIPEKPSDDPSYIAALRVSIPHFPVRETYLTVRSNDDDCIVTAQIGAIKHGRPMMAFDEPLRIVPTDRLKGQVIDVHCVIHGKNLSPARSEKFSISSDDRFVNGDPRIVGLRACKSDLQKCGR